MRIYVMRHGQTEENLRVAHTGWAHVPLTERGIAQAKGLRERLYGLSFDKVIVSDLLRAQQTAENALPNYDYQIDWRVREIHVGSLSGHSVKDCNKNFGAEYAKNRWERNFKPYGGENLNELCSRVSQFMDDLTKEPEDASIAVVCHEGAMIAMLMHVMQCDLNYLPAHADNCSIAVFTYQSGKWILNKWNEKGSLISER